MWGIWVSHQWLTRGFVLVSFFRMGKLTNNWGDNKKKLCLSNDNEQVNLETLVTVLKLSRKHLHKNQPMPSHSHTVVVHYKQRETRP